VQGVVGGVLNRHENLTLDKKRIQTLMVEIAADINLVIHSKGLAKTKPLSIEMWKGYYG
jgi:copper homeostasis protein CutC